MLRSPEFSILKNVEIRGIMGMASLTDDETQIRREFRQLRQYFESLKGNYFASQDSFREISMGMTSDYKIAIDEGSTMIRVGSALFGHRDYSQRSY